MRFPLALALALLPLPALAHTKGCDGAPVPAHIKSNCCGVADAHQIDPADIQQTPTGAWVMASPFKGQLLQFVVEPKDVQPSPDGCYWLFYSDTYSADRPVVYCFFAPMNL